MKNHKIQADETYLFQLIEAETGQRCPVFVSTPSHLCNYLAEKKARMFIVTLIHVNEDPDIGNLDLFLTVPVYSSLSWIATFKPELTEKAIANLDFETETKPTVVEWLGSKLGVSKNG